MSIKFRQGDARATLIEPKTVDMTLGSPPYLDARRSGRDDIARGLHDWVDGLMLPATKEAIRTTRGPVLWVCSGTTRDGEYQPGPEMLIARAADAGISLLRPCIWHKNGMPGSGGRGWFRNDYEFVLAFKGEGPLPWSDTLAMGTPPKYRRGGRMRNRGPHHQRCDRDYPVPKLANPGNVVRVPVGGGHLGHALAHKNEAPFPEALCEFFIRSFCPPGGTVMDPFCGSGTTLAVARRLGRNGIGIDIRPEQVALA
jgi:site-specific DNA-methyltransferase (adenine-specific)/site-specific DNA-methyltransferase (cytosine-N4-specific)